MGAIKGENDVSRSNDVTILIIKFKYWITINYYNYLQVIIGNRIRLI